MNTIKFGALHGASIFVQAWLFVNAGLLSIVTGGLVGAVVFPTMLSLRREIWYWITLASSVIILGVVQHFV